MGGNTSQFTAALQKAAVSHGKGTSLDALRAVNEGRGKKNPKGFKEPLPRLLTPLEHLKLYKIIPLNQLQ